NGIHIVDLAQTVPLLHQALVAVTETVAKGGRVLFVGTKRAAQVSSPTPANSIDTVGKGYVVANDVAIPTTNLWIFPVTGPATGLPTLLAAGKITIPTAAMPAGARQPASSQLLDTSDTRMTQAVMARNPTQSKALSLWTQHTVRNTASSSRIQWYEIGPTVSPPVLLRFGTIAGSSTEFFFNAAISPDRRVDGTTAAKGGSFVIGYNVSSPSIFPRIVMGSSVNGAGVTYKVVKNGGGPYRDYSCPSPGDTCRWGDYSGAAPDPRPQGGAARAVGLTNQFSPSGATSTSQSNWRTWIWHAAP
ncbi:MAG: 30S ribosomal protein S2, partial [Hyphomicrobiales bacterium]